MEKLEQFLSSRLLQMSEKLQKNNTSNTNNMRQEQTVLKDFLANRKMKLINYTEATLQTIMLIKLEQKVLNLAMKCRQK